MNISLNNFSLKIVIITTVTLFFFQCQEEVKVKEFNLTFYFNNGNKERIVKIKENHKIFFFDTPQKNGHQFVNWYLDENFNEVFDSNAAINSNLSLYAKWQINTYKISFEVNGGSIIESQQINYKQKLNKPKTPTKKEHSFINWHLNENFNYAFDFNTLIISNFTLYAEWQINSYTVSFEVNGGSIIDQQKINYHQKVIKPNDPTKNNYIFAGWYLQDNFKNKFNFSTLVTQNFSIYAQWQTIKGRHYTTKDFSDAANTSPYAIAKYQNYFYILDGNLKKVFVYDQNGRREPSKDFNLNDSNQHGKGIFYYNGKFYITDHIDDKIYIYDENGSYLNSVNLHADNGSAYGITFYNNHFYITDSGDDKVYTYDVDFNRNSTLDFSTAASGNTSPFGITYYNERFYITDSSDDKVYCYQVDGTRDASKDFDTVSTGIAVTSNGDPKGVFAFEDYFYIVDSSDDKVYVYGTGKEK